MIFRAGPDLSSLYLHKKLKLSGFRANAGAFNNENRVRGGSFIVEV